MKKNFKSSWLPIAAVILISMAFAVISITRATTIGTNIDSSAINASSTLQATGAVIFYGNATFGTTTAPFILFNGTLGASSTALFTSGLTTYGNSIFGDQSTDVNLFTGTLQASSTALFTSGLTTYGNSTFGDQNTDINLFTGTLQASSTALFTDNATFYGRANIANASSTLANFGGGTTVAGLLFGTCTPSFGTVTASTTKTVVCGNTVLTGYNVFVTPYITNPQIIFSSASSTASGVSVAVYNTGVTGDVVTTDRLWSWMAIK